MVYLNLKKIFYQKIFKHYPTSELDAIWQFCLDFVLMKNREFFVVNPDLEINVVNIKRILNIADRLLNGEPIQYIIGKSYFFNEIFEVNKNVLIPRPETEELIKIVLNKIENPQAKILDIGTGSGCIPIIIKKYFPKTAIYAIDISTQAIETAKINETIITGNSSIVFTNADITDKKFCKYFDKNFDLIVSNPPYIGLSEKANLEKKVVEFEPHIALFSKYDPLRFYKHIIKHSKNLLKNNGTICFEINNKYSNQICKLLENYNFKKIEILKDFLENDRFITAENA